MPLKRREFPEAGRSGAAWLPAVVRPAPAEGRGTARRPNILFIMSDDHAYQAISCYDGRLNKTPSIDRLAAGGVRFERSFCTNSICAPARAVLLTGKYSHRNGVIDNAVRLRRLADDLPQAPARRPATRPRSFGKWHLKTDPTGFDSLVHPARPGRLLQPGFHHQRRPRDPPGLRHGPGHGRRPGLAHGPATRPSRSASSCTTRRPIATGCPTPSTSGSTRARRARCRTPSTTITPRAATPPGSRRCASPTT